MWWNCLGHNNLRIWGVRSHQLSLYNFTRVIRPSWRYSCHRDNAELSWWINQVEVPGYHRVTLRQGQCLGYIMRSWKLFEWGQCVQSDLTADSYLTVVSSGDLRIHLLNRAWETILILVKTPRANYPSDCWIISPWCFLQIALLSHMIIYWRTTQEKKKHAASHPPVSLTSVSQHLSQQ